MYSQIRLPLACLLIIIYCFWYYSRKKRLQTRASKVFTGLVFVSILNLLATTITEYTVNNRDAVPELFNYVWHVVFLVTLALWCALLLCYGLMLIERSTGVRQQSTKIAVIVVCAVAVIAEIVLPIEYRDTPEGSYSLGMKAYALYVMVAFFLVLMPWKALRYRKVLGRAKSDVFLASTVVFIVVSLVQMVWPHMLLTDVGITMILLGLMVSTEDSNVYVSLATGLYNEQACREIISEKLFAGAPFKVCVYVFVGDVAAVESAIASLSRRLERANSSLVCAAVMGNVLVVMPLTKRSEREADPEWLPQPNLGGIHVRYGSQILEFTGAESYGTVESAIRTCKSRYEAEDLKRDDMTGLLRREAFTHLVNGMLERKEAFTLLMIDLDDFKNVNDTLGHRVGDDVLRHAANTFESVIRGSDVACRMGGDEFSIVLAGVTDPSEVHGIVERIMGKMEHGPASLGADQAIGVSVGARIHLADGPERTFEDVYEQADKALYQVKGSGKGAIAFFGDAKGIGGLSTVPSKPAQAAATAG